MEVISLMRKIKAVKLQFTMKKHEPCVNHILNLIVKVKMKSFTIPSIMTLDMNAIDVSMMAKHYVNEEDISIEEN